MRRWLAIIAFGVAGLLVAVAFSLGALALAGKDISQPASNVDIVATTPTPEPSESPEAEPTEKPDRDDDHGKGIEPTPTVDDHGGDSTSGSGSSSGSNESVSSESGSNESGSGDSGSDEGEDGGEDD
jgi:hypothetical protein